MEKVIVYVDGFNFYHSLKSLRFPNKFVNVWSLSESILRPTHQLEAVKYFSAYALWRKRSFPKHKKYVAQLRNAGVTPIISHFKTKKTTCPKCGKLVTKHEEKETDIRIALTMFEDAVDDKFDLAIVISADSDLVPVVDRINKRFPNKFVSVFTPPKRFGSARDLIKVATSAREITAGRVRKHLF